MRVLVLSAWRRATSREDAAAPPPPSSAVAAAGKPREATEERREVAVPLREVRRPKRDLMGEICIVCLCVRVCVCVCVRRRVGSATSLWRMWMGVEVWVSVDGCASVRLCRGCRGAAGG